MYNDRYRQQRFGIHDDHLDDGWPQLPGIWGRPGTQMVLVSLLVVGLFVAVGVGLTASDRTASLAPTRTDFEAELTGCTNSSSGRATARGTIDNTGARTLRYTPKVLFRSPDGAVLDVTFATAIVLPPGTSGNFEAATNAAEVDDRDIRCELHQIHTSSP